MLLRGWLNDASTGTSTLSTRRTGEAVGPVGLRVTAVEVTRQVPVPWSRTPEYVTVPPSSVIVRAGSRYGSRALLSGSESTAIALFTPASASAYAFWSALERDEVRA